MIRFILLQPNLRKMYAALLLTSVEAFLAILAILSGVPILINPTSLAPGSVLAILDTWALYVWGAGMAAGGTAAFLGILFDELRLEQMGVTALGCTVLVFSIGLIGGLPSSLLGLVTFVLFFLSMLARWWVLGRLIKIRDEVMREVREQNERG